jgi:hypothetical protein
MHLGICSLIAYIFNKEDAYLHLAKHALLGKPEIGQEILEIVPVDNIS